MLNSYHTGTIRRTHYSDFGKMELRPWDRLEFETGNYAEADFGRAMRAAMLICPMWTGVTTRGDIGFILGINPDNFIWLLGTEHMKSASFEIARYTKKTIQELREEKGPLRTHALALDPVRNRWLTWMGFTKVGHVPARGKLQLPFNDYEYN